MSSRVKRWSEIDITREEYDALQHLIKTGTLPKEYTMNELCARLVEILNAAFAGEDDEPSSYAVGETLKVLLRIPETLRGSPRLTSLSSGSMHIRFVQDGRTILISIPAYAGNHHYIVYSDKQTGESGILDYTPEALVEKMHWFYE